MYHILHAIFGAGKDLSIFQMSSRAFVLFFITLLLIRIAGLRAIGQKSAFDSIIMILLGAVLSRAVVGASPVFATIAASTMLSIIHRLVAMLAVRNEFIGSLIKGEKILLFTKGKLLENAMRKTCISRKDLMEELRLTTNEKKLENIDEIYMERSGQISFVKKSNQDA